MENTGEFEYGPKISEVDLHRKLTEALSLYGFERFYKYQYEAYRCISDRADTMIVSGAATSKTEAFIIPVMDRVLKEGVRALIIYPTKALARGQFDRFTKFGFVSGFRTAIFDGDTPESERRRIAEKPPHILITNPDMIHYGLAGSSRFRGILKGIRIIVLDETHIYEGAFGSHMKYILERLKLTLGELQFVTSSATIGNPYEFGKMMFERDVKVVYGPRRGVGATYHAMVSSRSFSRCLVASRLISILSSHGFKTLTFIDSQQMAEVVAKLARRNGTNIYVHRAGLPKEERVEVEAMLRSGKIDGVVSTPTLELGIDIGVLDAVIMAAPPLSYVKYLQRSGRSGRRGVGYVFMILGDDPIDAYYERRPTEYYEQKLTPIVFEPDNEEIAKLHFMGVIAQGVRAYRRMPMKWKPILDMLLASGCIAEDGIYYRLTEAGWNILRESGSRGAGPRVSIYDTDGSIIGFRELPAALHDLHPHAIYIHQGEVYEVIELDLDRYIARVMKRSYDLSFYTRALYEVYIGKVKIEDERIVDGIPVVYGGGYITRSVVGYTIHDLYGGEMRQPISICYLDEPISWTYKTKLMITKYGDEIDIEGIHALEHTLIHSARIIAGAGLTDLGGVSYPSGHIVVYDSTPGGSGLAKLLYRNLNRAHRVSYRILSECVCDDGCPRCVYDPFCGNGNRLLSRRMALKLLGSVLKNEVKVKYDIEPKGRSTP
jgi:DEAD/DEAH box helicase domain-containing protein